MKRWTLISLAGLVVGAAVLALPPPARAQETCETAVTLPCGSVTQPTNTAGALNDYTLSEGGCTGFTADGPDVVYRIVLAAGASLHLEFIETYDASIYLITDCANPEGSCVAGSDCFPPSCTDVINYTNDGSGAQTLFLIVDGFSDVDQGAGLLTGTIECAPPPPVIGACCDPSTGGCTVQSSVSCANAGGDFQGEGTTCTPNPCPPAESRCIRPGLTAATDPSGDFDPQLGNSQQDVQRVWFAEPDGENGFVVSMKVDHLEANPANLPVNTLWTVLWINPALDDTFFVQMNTCDPTESPAFAYGHVESPIQTADGSANGSYTPDGVITIHIQPALVGNSQPGASLANVIGETRVLAGTACSGLIQTIDTSDDSRSYTVRGNAYCRPHTVGCPPDAEVTPGNHSLQFVVNNPSTASRSFDVTLSDGEGWIVGGPITTTVGPVNPGGSGSIMATLRTDAECDPPITDVIQWQATALDLPAPSNVAGCATDLTCRRPPTGVDGGPLSFAIGVAGSNPFQGRTTIAYSIPERAPVRIDVYSITGQRVRTLVHREHEPGRYSVPFQLRGENRTSLGSGFYLVRITAGKETRTLRVVARE